MFDTLELQKTSLPLKEENGVSNLMYLDFILNGVSLKEYLRCEEATVRATLFRGQYRPPVRDFLTRLKQFKPSLPDSREEIYVCPFCADLACGSVTVQMVMTDDAVVWKNFGYQGSEEKWTPLEPALEFRFQKAAYFSSFYGLAPQFKALVNDQE
ncbi:hypothetical protein [Deinococcus cellulosilyticus]|uniref:hypothetical protein n=1 Tax=Deinococcus cellulosilyticus TaxID=401558 RepID=UPI0011BDA29E|nr:hypothetical protein [Deinococcus cellulosilyticus]